MLVLLDERIDLGIDRFLEHLPGALSDELIQRTSIIKLLAKGEHFRIQMVVYWRWSSVCFSLAHGVSLCPCWAAEV